MNKKNKLQLALSLIILASLNTVLGDFTSGNVIDGNYNDKSYYQDDYDSSSGDIEDSLNDDSFQTNSDIEKDLNFSEDGKIGVNSDITGDIIAEKNLIIGSNTTINGNIFVKGNLKISSNVDITGYVKVLGDLDIGSSSQITGTIYGYGKINLGVNVETNGKIKATGLLTTGTNYDGVGKLYAFGGKNMGINADFSDNIEKGILGKIDGYLKIDISLEDLKIVGNICKEYDTDYSKTLSSFKKAKISLSILNNKLKLTKQEDLDSINNEIDSTKQQLDGLKDNANKLINTFINNISEYIENEDFDQKGLSVYVKNAELEKFDMFLDDNKNNVSDNSQNQTIQTSTTSTINTNTTNNDKFKASLRSIFEKKLNTFDESKRLDLLNTLSPKIDQILSKTTNTKLKNTLTVLKSVISDMIDEYGIGSDIDNLLNSDNIQNSSTGGTVPDSE
ncbi:MAG: polymer-forming cytoskeletal protein [Candidatus Gracilibacteria bacterium]|nr:polymer-forming cytoskeletal protein [Candidatus Gracilibacteria bacterium]